MSARINFEDNLFYVRAWLKQLRAANRLDIDADIFLHKIVEDILFIHEVLRKLNLNLQRNEAFIQRLDYLRLLVLAKKEFVLFIEELQMDTSAFAENLIPFHDQFMQCRNIHWEDIQAITAILEHEAGMDKEESDIISSDEYRFLFNPDGDSDIV
jgi:hypothetical protein